MVNLKQLNNRIEWDLKFKVISPIHIGGNEEKKKNQHNKDAKAATPSFLDVSNPNDAKYLILPGSSFRGITRNYLDQLQQQLTLEETFNVLLNDLYGDTHSAKVKDSRNLKGRLWFSDVRIPKSASIIKNLTPINRLTHKPVAPLTLQTVKPDTTFSLKLTLENASSRELGIVALLLRAFYEQQLTIGAAQSRGLGRISLIECATTIYQYGHKKVTEDNIALPLENFEATRTLLNTVYKKTDIDDQIYTWLQFAADQLQQHVVKGVGR